MHRVLACRVFRFACFQLQFYSEFMFNICFGTLEFVRSFAVAVCVSWRRRSDVSMMFEMFSG